MAHNDSRYLAAAGVGVQASVDCILFDMAIIGGPC
jgi:hypothetical protein